MCPRRGGALATRPPANPGRGAPTADRSDRIAGSQTGSQQSQTLSDTRPRPAKIGAARQHVRPHPAPSGDGQRVPSKQRVAGSNPARRAGQRHITILSLIDRSPSGSQRERMAAAAALPPARGTEAGLPRCQRHVASVITARLSAVMIGSPAARCGWRCRAEQLFFLPGVRPGDTPLSRGNGLARARVFPDRRVRASLRSRDLPDSVMC